MVREIALALVVKRRQVIPPDAEAGLALEDFTDLLPCRGFISHLRKAGGEQRQMKMIGRSNALHSLGRLGIAVRDKKSASKMAPEARRVVGVEAHRFPDVFDAFFRLPEPSGDLALLHDDQVVVGIEAERALLV